MSDIGKTVASVLLLVIVLATVLGIFGPAIGTTELAIGSVLLAAAGYGIYRWHRHRTRTVEQQ